MSFKTSPALTPIPSSQELRCKQPYPSLQWLGVRGRAAGARHHECLSAFGAAGPGLSFRAVALANQRPNHDAAPYVIPDDAAHRETTSAFVIGVGVGASSEAAGVL